MVRRIRVRRGTAADWSTINPILAEGEFGYSTSDQVVKIGNGTSSWNTLGKLIKENDSPRFNTLGLGTVAPVDFGFDVLTGTSSGNRHLYTVNGGTRFQRRGDTSGWAFSYGFTTNDNLVSGGFGATGSNTAINYYYIGTDLNDTMFRATPSNGFIGLGLAVAATERLDVNGNIRVRSLTTNAGDFVTASPTGVLNRRTAAQVLSDIGAAPASSSSNYIQNQNSSNQSADFRITGVARANGGGLFSGATILRGDVSIGTNSTGPQTRSLHIGYGLLDFYGWRITNINDAASTSAGNLLIQRGTTSSWRNEVILDNLGNVGLNVTPTQRLHVSGNGLFTGWIQAGNIRINSNTISSENTNGNIILFLNGTGKVVYNAPEDNSLTTALFLNSSHEIHRRALGSMAFSNGGAYTAILPADLSNWNTAFSWGNHASAGYLLSSAAATTYVALGGSYANPSWLTSLAWSKLTGVPSTFAPSAHNHSASEITSGTISYARLPFNSSDVTNWNSAFGWGNHAGLYAPASGSGNYIQNQSSSAQSSANAWLSGFVQAGNLRLAVSTISAQNTNGDIRLTPNGSGIVYLGSGTKSGTVGKLEIAYDGASNGIGIFDGTGLSFRIYRESNNAIFQRGSTPALTINSASRLIPAVDVDGTASNALLLNGSGIMVSRSLGTGAFAAITDYLTISAAASTYEPAFSKNSAFNKNFGTSSGTVAEGNDSRILNGVTAFGWGNHASAGYLLSSAAATTYVALGGSYANPSWLTSLAWSKLTGVPSTFAPSAHNHSASEITSGTISYARLPFNAGDVANWNSAFAWGNHALAGYLLTTNAATTYVALGGSYANPSWIASLAWNKLTGVPTIGAPSEYLKVHLDINNATIPSQISPLVNSTSYHIPGDAASNSGIYTPIVWDVESEDIGSRFDSGVITIYPGEIWQITASIECFWATQGTGNSWVPVLGQSPIQGISLDLVIVEVDVNSNEQIIAKQTADGTYARYPDTLFSNEERSLFMNTEVNHQYHNNSTSESYLYIAARSWLPYDLGINPAPEVTRLTAKRLK